MYSQNQQPQRTLIHDLPDIDDMVDNRGGNDAHNNGNNEHVATQGLNLDKFLRVSQRMDPSSGMLASRPQPAMQSMQSIQPMHFQPQYDDNEDRHPTQLPFSKFGIGNLLNISCIEIAGHIRECPICSKFYDNDKTIHIIAIVVLSIICLLLMKRVLNV